MSKRISKVVVTWAGPEWIPRLQASLSGPEFAHVKVVYCLERDDVLREIADADAAYVDLFDNGLLRPARKLQWLHFMRGGIDDCMFPELVESPVVATCLKELFATPGAEFALMAMLMIQRRMIAAVGGPKLSQRMDALNFSIKPQDLAAKTVGIVGLGGIGRRVAELSRAFQMRVLGTARRRPADSGLVDAFMPSEDLAALTSAADFVVISIPYTPATHGFIGPAFLHSLKPGAWVIDVTARAKLWDYAAMKTALESGRLGGVFLQPCGADSPDIPSPTDPLWQRENVIVSPCRTNSLEQMAKSIALFPENLLRFEAGQPLRGLVFKAAGY